jgi:CRISPR type II-A-associated protein Csn2
LLSAKAKLIEFAKSLATNCEFEIDYNPEIDVSGLLKLLAFKVNKEGLSSAEQLIMYLKLVARYLKTDLFFIQNLHLFYSKEEIEGIYDDILLNQLNLVILENYQEKYVLMNEKYLIVDNDLCIIDN